MKRANNHKRRARQLGAIIFLALIVGAGAAFVVKLLTPVMVEAKVKRVIARGALGG